MLHLCSCARNAKLGNRRRDLQQSLAVDSQCMDNASHRASRSETIKTGTISTWVLKDSCAERKCTDVGGQELLRDIVFLYE